jgi:phage tail-like protein
MNEDIPLYAVLRDGHRWDDGVVLRDLVLEPDGALRLAAGIAPQFVPAGELTAGPFDAGDGGAWGRVHVTTEAPDGTSVTLRAAATERPVSPIAWSAAASGDTLLFDGRASSNRGRYLWVSVSLDTHDPNRTPRLRQVEAETASEGYLGVLPTLYARADADTGFLWRWLETFRADFGDWEHLLDDLPRDFDWKIAPDTALPALARAIAFEPPPGATAAALRELLGRAHALYRRRGTVAGLAELVEIYTGVRPRIVEAFRDRALWSLGSGGLGIGTRLAPALPDGMSVAPSPSVDPRLQGLWGEYFKGRSFEQSAFSRVDPVIDFHWGMAVPIATDFSIRWTGQILGPVSEIITFYVTADNGVRLWIDDELVIDSWHDQDPSERRGLARLVAGRWHSIRLEYGERVAGSSPPSGISLSWSHRDATKELIPRTSLYAAIDADVDLSPLAMVIGSAVVGEQGPLAADRLGEPLFSETAYLFTAYVPAALAPNAARRDAIRSVIDREKPAHTDYHLCFVETRLQLGVRDRLGLDAVVASGPPPLVLDGSRLGVASAVIDRPSPESSP